MENIFSVTKVRGMTIQTIEVAARRYVVVPEEEFHKLEQDAGRGQTQAGPVQRRPRFAAVSRVKVQGIPASQLLIQDRR